ASSSATSSAYAPCTSGTTTTRSAAGALHGSCAGAPLAHRHPPAAKTASRRAAFAARRCAGSGVARVITITLARRARRPARSIRRPREAVRGLRPFPDDVNGARLRSLVARFLAEPDLVTDSEILELGVENAVSMEIDVSSVRGRDAAVILLRMQLGDRAVRRTLVDLHLAANHSHAVLQLSAGSVE